MTSPEPGAYTFSVSPVPEREGGSREGSKGPRVLLGMGDALANLVALTLRHGRYDTRATRDPAECRQIVKEWEPHLAFIDIDRYEQFLTLFSQVTARTPVAVLAFTRKRDTAVKL